MQLLFNKLNFSSLNKIITKHGKFLRTLQLFQNLSSTLVIDRDIKLNSDDFYHYAGQKRCYFYVIDIRGQLHLENTKHRNFASCLKDKLFLSFFYRNLRRFPDHKYKLNQQQQEILVHIDRSEYFSPCGLELNFVRCIDPFSALGFVDYDASTNDLVYSCNTREAFICSRLIVNHQNGRLYHPITALPQLKGEIGLLHPSLSQQFCDKISVDAEGVCHIYFNDQFHQIESR